MGGLVRLLAMLIVLSAGAPAGAETLILPTSPGPLLADIATDCPGCADKGFLPCGTPDVQYGRRFPKTALQGAPARAYLLANAPTERELQPLLAGPDASTVADDLARRFIDLRLVVVENDWTTARALAPEAAAAVDVDPAQQACFRDPGRELYCCLGDGPRDAGCLPKADPPSVRLAFRDAATGEALSLRYPVGRGEVRLRRRTADGARTLYWCHKWARAGLTPAR